MAEEEEASLHKTEGEIEDIIAQKIRDVLVFGHPKSFGLVHRVGTVDFPEEQLGSWLNLITGKKKKNLSFFMLDDANSSLVQKRGKHDKPGRTEKRKYSDISYVHVKVSEKPYQCSFHVETESGKAWVLRPIQDDDSDVVIHWVAALRYRANLYPDNLLFQQQKALKAVVWLQSKYRQKKAVEKAERRRERRRGLLNKAMGWLYGGYDDSDSDSDDDVEEEDPLQQQNNGGFTSMLASIIQDAYQATFASTEDGVDEEELRKQLQMDEETKNKFRLELANASELLDKNELKPLLQNELEDEVWENERWVLKTRDWAPSTGNRLQFTDRIGRRPGKSMDKVVLPMPTEWEVKSDFQIDMSGLNTARCGKDGWCYQLDFGPIESDLAKGKFQIKPSTGHVVRRRRWYRRRVLKDGKQPAISHVLWHGWLGKKGLTTGRWTNRYFVLTNGMVINGKRTGVSLSYFRYKTADHMKYIEAQDTSVWESLTPKDIKTYNLDGSKVNKDEKKPGYFSLQLSHERRLKRVFNATNEDAREIWLKWIKYAVSDQEKRFTLTRITMQKTLAAKKETSYDMIPTLAWSLLDCLVPAHVDTFVHLAYFDTTFLTNLNKALHCVNFNQTLPWTARDGRKGSRREYQYILPRQNSKLASTLSRTRVIEKFKIEKHDPGLGIYVTKSLEFPDITYGDLFRCMVRTVVTKWKGNRARVCVSMEVDLKTQDQGIFDYLESLMRKYTLQYYQDIWMPLLGKAIKHFDKTNTDKKPTFTIQSPGGVLHEVAEVEKYKKGKIKKELDLKPLPKGYKKIKDVI